MTLPLKFPSFDFFDYHLPFAKTDSSPGELWRLGQQSLADGWRMARAYFRAAARVLLDRWALGLERVGLAPVRRVESHSLYRSVNAETRHARRQLSEAFRPVWAAVLEAILPLPRLNLRYGLALLLVVDILLWGGLMGLFGLATVEGSRAPVEAVGVKMAARPASVIAAPFTLPSALPTSAADVVATATPIVLEATPIPTPLPIVFSAWTPYLPAEAGWEGGGACWGEASAPIGSGYFVWPTDNHYLSGYDYSIYHLGLDITVWLGDPIYAADAGAVVYAGWNDWGYGNLIIIDHGNGWHTLYGHLSQINVTCGQGVAQGELIGLAGSTGHSTGPHLHFEMRAGDGRVNPWYYLP